MIRYGEKKLGSVKLHSHNKCHICGEKTIIKKSARQSAKKELQEEAEMVWIRGAK